MRWRWLIGWLTVAVLAAQPELAPNKVNFGVKGQHQILEETLTLSNPGPSTLTVSTVEGSCDCTSAEIDRKSVPAGGSARIRLLVATGEFEGDVRRELFVHTTAGDVRVPILMTISKYPDWAVNPTSVTFGQAQPDADLGTVTLRYVGPAKNSYKPSAVISGTVAVSVRAEPTSNNVYQFKLRSLAGKGNQAVRGFLLIRTGDPAAQEIWVRIAGYLRAPD